MWSVYDWGGGLWEDRRGLAQRLYICVSTKGKLCCVLMELMQKKPANDANSAPLSKGAKQGSLMNGASVQQFKLEGAGAGPAGAVCF